MNKHQSGFTLLELLIAMTLLGLILVMVYSGLRLGMRGWDAGEQRADAMNEMRLVQDFLRRQFEQSALVYWDDPTGGRKVPFAGELQSLTLVTPMLAHLGLGGLYMVHFDIVNDQGTGRLQMRWYPYRPDGSGVEVVDETTLVSEVSGLQWSYFGFTETNREPQWHEEWRDVSWRPLLVRLSLSVQGERWPDLVVKLPN